MHKSGATPSFSDTSYGHPKQCKKGTNWARIVPPPPWPKSTEFDPQHHFQLERPDRRMRGGEAARKSRSAVQWVATISVAVLWPVAPALEAHRRGRERHQQADEPATPPNTYALSCSSFPSLHAIRQHSMQRRVYGMMNWYSIWMIHKTPRHKSATHRLSRD